MPEDEIHQYDTLLRSMEAGLLVTINGAAHSATPSFELQVDDSCDDETYVRLSGYGREYQIHRDRRGELVYSEVTEDGPDYEDQVETFEIVGIDGRAKDAGVAQAGDCDA